MKYLISVILLIAGCNHSSSFPLTELIKAEGLTAYVAEAEHKIQIKQEEIEAEKRASEAKAALEAAQAAAKEIEIQAKAKAEEIRIAEAKKNEVKVPQKYLRLLSAEQGCGPCIHQEQILTGSDWIILHGTEKDNQEKLPYHGLKEEVKSMEDTDNPLWKKYKAKFVPFWQLVENGKVVKTYDGVMTLTQLRDFYLNMDLKGKHNNEDCTCDECKCGAGCQCGK